MLTFGIFYDGTYLQRATEYFFFNHQVHRWLNLQSFQLWLEQYLDKQTEEHGCRCVEAHYYQGRVPASVISETDVLTDRRMDDRLTRQGVTAHYLTIPTGTNGWREKGVDVALALDAFEAAVVWKKLDIVVLFAGDADFVPLVRKLACHRIRVLVIGMEFQYVGTDQENHSTGIARDLLAAATWAFALNKMLDGDKSSQIVGIIFDETRGCAPAGGTATAWQDLCIEGWLWIHRA